MTIEIAVIPLTVIFVACLVRSTFGFGEALVGMPILTMMLGVRVAAPLIALLSITIAAGILVRDWRSVQWSSAWRLVVSSLVGIPIGLYLLTSVPEAAVKVVLAIVMITFSAYCLARPGRIKLHSDFAAPLFGFAAGILGGAYNTQGAPLVIYGSLRQWPAEKFRATLQSFFIPTSVVIVAGHAIGGRVTDDVVRLYALSLPLALVALLLGGWLSRRVMAQHFVGWLYVVLIVIGLLLLGNALVCVLLPV